MTFNNPNTAGGGADNMVVIKNSTLADRNNSRLFSNFQYDQCNQDILYLGQ